MKSLKIILVDDNDAFRDSLKQLLVLQYNIQIIGEASSAEEFWKLHNYGAADIILMDIMMPTEGGIDIAKKVLNRDRTVKIIALTMHTDHVYLTTLIEAGFLGCIFKCDLYNSLEPALENVMKGKRFFPDNIML